MLQILTFHALAGLITLCSVMVVASRNPVTSAVFLVVDLFCIAGLYAQLDAHFIAAIQVLIYAGAILVLFVFVIMLLNLEVTRASWKVSAPEMGVLFVTLIGFVAIAVMMALGEPGGQAGNMTPEAIQAAGGNTYVLGMLLFTKYLWPFELASILILLAIVASIVIAKKDKVEKPAGDKKGKVLAHGTR